MRKEAFHLVEHNHFVFIAENLRTGLLALRGDGVVLDRVYCTLTGERPELARELTGALLALRPERGIRTVLTGGRYCYSLFGTPDGKTILVGPNAVVNHDPFRHTLPLDGDAGLMHEDIYGLSIDNYLRVLLPSYNLYYEQMLTEAQYLESNFLNASDEHVQKGYQERLFTSREERFSHNPYSQEKRMLSAVETGDLVLLEECRRQEITDQTGPVRFGSLSDNAERSYRNLAICAVTLVSRAAIRGGINPELAFSLCDSYITQIERLTDLTHLASLTEKAKTSFCTMVKELRERTARADASAAKNPLVEKAKSYVFANLHRRVTLAQTAQKLHMNQNYLSELFKKTEGVSFSAFVLEEKLKLARKMLMYSDYSYVDIANYLGFSSQSHLGKLFREHYGMTLREFRNQYSANEYRD